jgi:hypothetical protein
LGNTTFVSVLKPAYIAVCLAKYYCTPSPMCSLHCRECSGFEYARLSSCLVAFRSRRESNRDTICIEDIIVAPLHCDRWPEPNSVLVMDNASFHHTEWIEQRCADAGAKLISLRPHSSTPYSDPGALRRISSGIKFVSTPLSEGKRKRGFSII